MKDRCLRKFNKDITCVLLWNVGTLLLFSLLFYPRFYSDMDIFMQSAVYGIAGVRSSYIVFTNILIGKVLTLLMEIAPMIPWYIVFHYACCLVSLSVITFVVLKRNNTAMGKVLVGIILAFLGFECYVEPNYMKTAVILCVSAVSLLFYLYKQELCQKKLYKWLCLVGLFMLLSSMICFRAFLISGIMAMISFIIYICKNKCEKKDILLLIVTLLVVAALSSGMRLVDTKIYEQVGNELVLSYRSSIEKILGYGAPEGEDALYEKYNLDEEQYEVLRQGYFSNIDNTNLELIKSISMETKTFSLETLKGFFREVPIHFFETGVLYYFIVLSFLYMLIGKGKISTLFLSWGMVLVEYIVLYIWNAWEYKWIGFMVFVPASLYILYHMKDLQSAEVKTVIVYVAVLGIVLYSKFSPEIAMDVNDQPMISVYEEAVDLEADVLMIDMIEYLREYSGFQVYEMAYVADKVYWANGVYGLIEPYAAWTRLEQMDEDKEYKWLYNPEKVKVRHLFVFSEEGT